jgi:adenosylcobinamide-GDP ribazoletransferase
MPACLQGLWAAFAFLSRLAPARMLPDAAFARAVPWYPLVGLALGVLAASAALVWPLFSPFFVTTWIWPAAWTYALVLAWLTRGLHWDGLADLADAAGSGRRGVSFRAVLKDSRIGVFGTLALVMGVGGQLVFAAGCLEQGDIGLLVWGPVFGRALIVPLARLAPPHPDAGLGLPAHSGARGIRAGGAAAAALGAGWFLAGPPAFLAGLALALAGLLGLSRMAGREGGLSGDYFGAMVVWGELSALCAGALLHF